MALQAGAYPGFCSRKRLGVFLSILVLSQCCVEQCLEVGFVGCAMVILQYTCRILPLSLLPSNISIGLQFNCCRQVNKPEEADDKHSAQEEEEEDTVEEDQEDEEEEEEEISELEEEFALEEPESPEPRKKRHRPLPAQAGQRKRGRPAVNREGAMEQQLKPAERTERRRKRSEHEQERMEKDLEVDIRGTFMI